MHIDHSKLVELLSEASGMKKAEVEEQLKLMADEIQQAIKEGDAYEVEGFGIFSGIGNNTIFIPSEELSTEINYKYVGMEAISVDSAEDTENVEDVFSELDDNQGIAEEVEESEEDDPEIISDEKTDSDLDIDPFAGLLDDIGTESTGKEDPDANDSSVDEAESEDVTDAKTYQTNDDLSYDEVFDDLVFGEDEKEEKPAPGPEKWGIDSYRDESDENMFSGLLGDKEATESDEESSSEDTDDIKASADEPALSIQLDDSSDVEDTFTSDQTDDDDDFDDPFKGMEDSDEEEIQQDQHDDEVIPVITNISSGSGEKETPENSGLQPKTRSTRDRNSSPVFLWILLSLIILGGATYALGYFGIVNIPGIEPKIASNETNPSQNTVPQGDADEEGAQMNNNEPEINEESQSPAAEQNTVQDDAQVSEQNQTVPLKQQGETVPQQEQDEADVVTQSTQEPPANQPTYGLMGVPNEAANDGYTIVIYSLSVQSNAENQRVKLLEEGYRALVYSLPHAQYGTLYRVSLGQFESLRDAALAAEKLKPPYSENYFITNIQPTN